MQSENTNHRGKYYSTADLLFDLFGFDQTTKTVANKTNAKQLNPNKKTRDEPYSDTSPYAKCSQHVM